MDVGLGARDQALLPELGDDRPLRLGDREPGEPLGRLGRDPTVLADHLRLGETVAAPDLEVVGVMRRRDLQRAGPELGLDVVVGDDLQSAPDERQDRRLADQAPVAVVVGMDRDRRVGEHRLRPHGRDRDRAGAGRERVVDVVERVLALDLLDLEV